MKRTANSTSGGRPRRNPKAAASATFSVRFTPEERGYIEEAAASRREPAASFVREAAVDRACDILNFSGAEKELQPFAERLATQLNPVVTVVSRAQPEYSVRARETDFAPEVPELEERVTGVSYFSERDTRVLLDILETATTPFVAMLVDIIRKSLTEQDSYKPVVDRRKATPQAEIESGASIASAATKKGKEKVK